jgi:hypothetical protein
MGDPERHLRRKLFFGALVVAVAMGAWVLVINIGARH